jgi:hypothetical protein
MEGAYILETGYYCGKEVQKSKDDRCQREGDGFVKKECINFIDGKEQQQRFENKKEGNGIVKILCDHIAEKIEQHIGKKVRGGGQRPAAVRAAVDDEILVECRKIECIVVEDEIGHFVSKIETQVDGPHR